MCVGGWVINQNIPDNQGTPKCFDSFFSAFEPLKLQANELSSVPDAHWVDSLDNMLNESDDSDMAELEAWKRSTVNDQRYTLFL